MCTCIYAGTGVFGFLVSTTLHAAKNATRTPKIQALQASVPKLANPNTQGEMKTDIPSITLIPEEIGESGIANAHKATSTIAAPEIQAFHELVPLLHVAEYHGESFLCLHCGRNRITGRLSLRL